MGVNNVNNGSGVVWNSNTTRTKAEKAEVSNIAKPANTDKLVLNLPKSETVHNRQEFVTDERIGEGCAFCCTYIAGFFHPLALQKASSRSFCSSIE